MINFKDYKDLKLGEVATWERSKKGKTYPKGCTLIQISATNGDTRYLKEAQEVEAKYAVVKAKEGIDERYLNIVIEKNIDHFISKYKSGLNIQIDDLKHLDVQIHNKETQRAVVAYVERIEDEMYKESKLESIYTDIKKRFQKDMFI